MNESLSVKVNSVSWFMSPNGYAVGEIHFDPIAYEKQEFKEFALGYSKKFVDLGIIPGCTLHFERKVLEHGSSLVTGRVDNGGRPELPTECLACGHQLVLGEAGVKCGDEVCPNTSFSSVFRMCKVANPELDFCYENFDMVKRFLSSYPDKDGTPTRALDMFSLFSLNRQVGNKNTQLRQEIFNRTYGEVEGPILFDLDIKIDNKLREGLTNLEFWFVSSIPKLSNEGLNKLDILDPKFTTPNTLEGCGLSEEDKLAIKTYVDKWSVFTKFIPLKSGK